MTATKSRPTAAADARGMDAEHGVQVGLMNTLLTGVQQQEDHGAVADLLEQLVSYTNLHFMSEQLLMRLYAYPDFDRHDLEHEDMMAALRALQDQLPGASPETLAGAVEAIRAQLTDHIRVQDRALGKFLSQVGAPQA